MFTGVVAMYGILLTLSLLARLIVPETFSLMAVYITGAHVLLLSAVILFPLALLLCKPRALALLLLPPVIVFLVHYGSQFIPSREQEPFGGTTLRVMTYNIQWRNTGYQSAVDAIRAADADVVALQEVSPEAGRTLESLLADLYPYMALNPNSNGYAGAAVLSRFPISENSYFTAAFGGQRMMIDVNGMPFVLYNMHVATPLSQRGLLNLDVSQRNQEVRELVSWVQGESGRVVVVGDFNMPDLSDDYARLDSVLDDSYREVGWGMGWTHPGPFLVIGRMSWLRLLRLDYIFTGGSGVRALNMQVLADSGGSDHMPVVAALEVYDPSATYNP